MIEMIERQVELQEETEKPKQSDRFVNITLHEAVMSNYVVHRAEFCMCSTSIQPNDRALSQYLLLCPL